jgi:5-formyltetrahydrofolate cyclo-ligase
MTKSELRGAIRKKLDALSPSVLAEKSARICAAVAARDEWRRAKTVCLFASHTHEPDIDALWKNAAGKIVCYPRVDGDRLVLLRVEKISELKLSRWNLREPDFSPEKIVPPENIDALLAPGVAFSKTGGRLGRGGGFYDRLLADEKLRAFKIGVCFSEQIAGELPREAHDREVDVVVTD